MNTRKIYRVIRIIWITLGAGYLFAVTPYFEYLTKINIIPIINTLQIGLAFLCGASSGFILPGLFILFSVFSNKKKYPWLFLIFALIISILNTWFLYIAWPYGLQFQGKSYTIHIIIYNALSIISIFSLVMTGVKYKKIVLLDVATFLFFIFLAFLAFPHLGESI